MSDPIKALKWPGLSKQNWEEVNEQTLETEPFHSDAVRISALASAADDPEIKVQVKLYANVVFPKSLAATVESDELASLMLERILLDLNISLAPVLVYHIEKTLKEGNDARNS